MPDTIHQAVSARRRRTSPAKAAPLFLPREIPTYEAFVESSRRFPDLDPDALTAHLTLLHVVGTLLANGDAYFSRHGLSKGRFSVLVVLTFHSDHAMSPSELAEQLGVTRATITGLLDGLERDGLVRREPSPDDRRRLVVKLTPKAERAMNDFLPAHFRRIATLMGELSRDEKRTLVRLLGKVRVGLAAILNDT